MAQAPRLRLRALQRHVRGAWLTFVLGAAVAGSCAAAERVETRIGDAVARFEAPTHRYGHAIMGNLPEWGRLCLANVTGEACVTLPHDRVFEDIAPRLADVDLDGALDAIVVESSFSGGAALVVYRIADDQLERVATPPIGTRNRWLAPAAIADLDGDGHIELAYVDRPHLARTLRVWRFRNETLEHVTSLRGLTNHRIGEPFITGGLRICAGQPEIITADAYWTDVVATRLTGDTLEARRLAPFDSDAVRRAMACE